MTFFLFAFFQRLFQDLHLTAPARGPRRYEQLYELDEEAAGLLRSIASHEQRDEQAVASELLAQALQQRSAAEAHLQRWERLTGRERQVVALACEGHTNAEIAARLSISPQTVKSHLHNAVQKFGLQSRAQLVHYLAEWDFTSWLADNLA
jgi:DNA-binding CsgD family transcriptional regulator